MLELENVNSFYGNSPVLQGVDFSAQDASLVSVLGRNGVGKTTLMRTIMGLTDKATGTMHLNGEDVSALSTSDRALKGIAYVPQGRGILPRFTVRENILMGTFARPDQKREMPEHALEMFPYLKDNLNRRGGNLSGGQQQQLAIARALAAKPKVLLLDEPTEGIQPNIVEQIEDVIIQLNQKMGLTVILVEQNVPFARRASSHFCFLEKGSVAAKGTVDELSDDLVHEYMTV